MVIAGEGIHMYAVIQTGGKQYRVAEGDTLKVEKLVAEEGADIELDKVLMVADGDQIRVGKPYLEGGKVYQTDPWGTRDTSTGARYDGTPYNYIHFEGQNPVHPSEHMREISSYELKQMNR